MNEKKILYVQTSGIDRPENLYSPLILAQTAKAMDMDAALFFLGKGLTVITKGEAEKIQIGSYPPLSEVMDQTIKAGVKIYACEQSKRVLGWEETNFIEEAKIVGAATLNDFLLEYDGVMWF